MFNLKKLGVVLSVATISLFSLNGSAFALSDNVQVGTDPSGSPVMFDVDSITDKSYDLYQSYGDGIAVTTFEPSCSETRLIATRIAIYNSTARLISNDKFSEEVKVSPDSLAAVSLRMYCKAVGARGW